MITVEKLEKGTYFDDAFKISFRYDPTTVASLKVKLEMAEKIYSGLKKSLSKRIAEVDLDRFSKDKYTREPEDPMED